MKPTTYTLTVTGTASTTANGTYSPVPRHKLDLEAIKDLRLNDIDRVLRAVGLALTFVPRAAEEGKET